MILTFIKSLWQKLSGSSPKKEIDHNQIQDGQNLSNMIAQMTEKHKGNSILRTKPQEETNVVHSVDNILLATMHNVPGSIPEPMDFVREVQRQKGLFDNDDTIRRESIVPIPQSLLEEKKSVPIETETADLFPETKEPETKPKATRKRKSPAKSPTQPRKRKTQPVSEPKT